jgi:tetratricopeptide (TPR) repeat protein
MATDPSRKESEDDGGDRVSEHHFVSYSRAGDSAFVMKLKDALQKGQPRFKVWIDQSEMGPGSWPKQLEEAIDNCGSFLLVVSEETTKSTVCAQELARACNNGKVVIPLLRDPKVPKPLLAQNYEHVDFSRDFGIGLDKLRQFLKKLVPLGSVEQPPVKAESREINTVPSPVTIEPVVINDPPLMVPNHFQGRAEQQRIIEEFLADDASAVLWISGRAGSGKTALACHVLNQIRRGQWISTEHKVPIHAVIYLDREHQSRRDWFNVLQSFRNLSEATPCSYLQKGYLASAVEQILSGLSNRRVVFLVDHLDDLIDLETRNLTNPNLRDALQRVLALTEHRLKVIVTSRALPTNLPATQSRRLCGLNLGEGLPATEAMQLLEQMYQDGGIGLGEDDRKLLAELCRRTQGNPRAIEKLHAILQQDQDTSIEDILQHEKEFLPRAVLDLLIGESYACLDAVSKTMMQVLSVSEAPITAEGVATVFRHYHPDIDARQVLSRLVNIQLVKKTNDCYWLLKGDWSYVASQLVDGTSLTSGGPDGVHLNRFSLYQQYADYFKQVASTNDTTAEAELLIQAFRHDCKGKDYVAAIGVLKQLEPHLLEQGHYQELTQYYEQLEGKLEDPKLVRRRLDRLASIYQRLGKLDRAAAYYGEGLKCVRDEDDQNGQCLYLANLAICKQESCDLVGTTLYCMAALELARQKTRDSAVEAHIWNIISDSLANLGQIHVAAEVSRRGLELARNNFPRENEVSLRVNLGQHYEALGDSNRAQEECDRACRIVSTTRFQLGESAARRNLGVLKLSQRKFKLAAEEFSKALKLADITQSVQLQQTIRIELALSLLLGGELPEAETTISEALRYHTSLFSPEVHSLHGVILKRQEKAIEAAKSFSYALEEAQVVLKRTSGYYRVLDAMGLSYSGLTLSENEPYLDEAIEAYQASRLLTHDPGIVRRRLFLFDALAQSDSEKKLASVRDAIEPQQSIG